MRGPAIEIFPVLCQAPASSKPGEGALHNPLLGKTIKPFARSERLTISIFTCANIFPRRRETRALIATIGVELQQEWIKTEQRRHDKFAAIAILYVGGVHDGVDQQALRVDENVALLALDLFSRVVTRRINPGPPFSALFTLWLSMTAAVGLASRQTASRHFT